MIIYLCLIEEWIESSKRNRRFRNIVKEGSNIFIIDFSVFFIFIVFIYGGFL